MASWLVALALATAVLLPSASGFDDDDLKECGQDFIQLDRCVTKIFDEAKKERDERAAEQNRGKIACFTDQGCKRPTFGGGGAKKGLEEGCVKNIFEKDMKDTLLKCIREDVPSFSFPSKFWRMISERGKLVKAILKGGDPMDNLHAICDMRERFLAGCPEGEPRARAKACLIQHHKDRNKGKRNFAKDVTQIKECTEELTRDCKNKMQDIKDAICSCALNQMKNDDLKKKVFACGGGDEDAELNADQADKVVKSMAVLFCGKEKKAVKADSDSEEDDE